MIGRTRRLANQLEAALEGRAASVPEELLPLLAAADEVRAAARRIEPDHSLARQRIARSLRPEGRMVQLPRPEPRWGMRVAAVGVTAMAAAIPATVASTSSIPGDPLYPLKRGIEQVRVMAATSPEAEAAARTDIAYARLAELDALLEAGDLEHLPQVLIDLNSAVDSAAVAVAAARQEGADTIQVAAIESQLAGVAETQKDTLTAAMDQLPPEKAGELQDIIDEIPPSDPTTPPKGGDSRGSDEAGTQATTTVAPTTTAGGGVAGEPSTTTDPPATTSATTTAPPTTTQPPTTTAPAEPEQTSTPSANP